MMTMDLQAAAAVADGAVHGDAAGAFTGLSIDTRSLAPGNLFVALPGAHTDGHAHLADAREAGAAAALVDHRVDDPLPQLRVGNTRRAMGALAAHWRRRFELPVVGITGSNGKTTVKGMLAAIAARSRRCLVTRGNYNNELGLPLTLALLGPEHRAAILEMGCGKPGDIAHLAELALPSVGVVTNAGPAHLERLGTVDAVARTKGELFSALPPDGTAVINADDDYAELWRSLAGARRVLTFGMQGRPTVRAEYRGGREHAAVSLATDDWTLDVTLRVPGRHNAANAAAAAAAALALDIGPADIARGLEDFEPVAGRLQLQPQPGGWTLYEDSYNANPASLQAALEVLAEHAVPRWLVLGDMAELGPDAEALHFQAGVQAKRLGVERLLAVGPLAWHAVQGFGDGGEHFASLAALRQRLLAGLAPGVAVLVKGSRSAHMEELSAGIGSGANACS